MYTTCQALASEKPRSATVTGPKTCMSAGASAKTGTPTPIKTAIDKAGSEMIQTYEFGGA